MDESDPHHDQDPEDLYESRRHGFKAPIVGSGDPDFEDEPAGAYLQGLRVGPGTVAWGAALLFSAAVLVLLAVLLKGWTRASLILLVLLSARGPDATEFQPPWVPPLDMIWNALPVVATAGLLLTAFIRANLRTATAAEITLANRAMLLQLLTVIVCAVARWGFGVSFRVF